METGRHRLCNKPYSKQAQGRQLYYFGSEAQVTITRPDSRPYLGGLGGEHQWGEEGKRIIF